MVKDGDTVVGPDGRKYVAVKLSDEQHKKYLALRRELTVLDAFLRLEERCDADYEGREIDDELIERRAELAVLHHELFPDEARETAGKTVEQLLERAEASVEEREKN